MLNRRDAIKSMFIFTGALFVPKLGIYRPKPVDASWFAMMGSKTPWEEWDEKSEAGLARDDIFVCLFENTSAGTNEIGQGGGLSEANRTLTQSGNIAGATGAPPTRVLDGTDDDFTLTASALTSLFNQNTWTVIIKFKDATDPPVFVFAENYGGADYGLNFDNASRLQVYTTGFLIDSTFTDAISNSGDGYLCVWNDSKNNVRAGWKATKPLSWLDFPANQRLEGSANANSMQTGTFAGNSEIGSINAIFNAYNLYYVVIAKTSLIL